MIPFIVYLVLALIPSFIWLLFYLRKDAHPEPNWMILKVFLYGNLAVIPALLLEIGLGFLNQNLIFLLVGSVIIEELAKYLVVRWVVYPSPELDEPVDLMLYMVISALGFAALENLFFLLSPGLNSFIGLLDTTLVRFATAIFIHTLSSGVFGYFLARNYFRPQSRKTFSWLGFLFAIVLHASYNGLIIKLGGGAWPHPYLVLVLLSVLPLGLILLHFFSFKKLKKMPFTLPQSQ